MRRTTLLPVMLALSLGLVSGCDMSALGGLNKNTNPATSTIANANEYFPLADGSRWDMTLSSNGVSQGNAVGTMQKIDETSYRFKVAYRIGTVDKEIVQTYRWSNNELVVTEANNETYTALRGPVTLNDSWSVNSDTLKVVSIGDFQGPDGTIKDVVRVDRVNAGNIVCSLWYAKGIGIVQAEFSEDGSSAKLLLKMTKYTAQVPAITGASYLPFTDGALAEFKLSTSTSPDGALTDVGSAVGALTVADGTCSLNLLTDINGQEEGMSRSYSWSGSDLNVIEHSAEGSRATVGLKSSFRVGDSWTAGSDTYRIASVGDLETLASTALGTLHNVVRVDQLSGGNICSSMWYAEGVGIVQVRYQIQGSTNWITMKLSKYTANPSAITLTPTDLLPVSDTGHWTFDVKKAGATLGSLNATMSVLASTSARIDSLDGSENPAMSSSERFDITSNALSITSQYENPQTQTWLQFPIRVGKSWSVGDLSWAIVSHGPLTLGNTTYTDVVRVVRFKQGKVDGAYWFAKNKGPIKIEVFKGDTVPTFYELTSYTP